MYQKIINISDKRCTGKTSRLLLLAKELNAIFVCSDPNIYREKAYQYGIVGIDFISYLQYIDILKRGKIDERQYVIDELDYFLNVLSSNKIVAYDNSVEG